MTTPRAARIAEIAVPEGIKVLDAWACPRHPGQNVAQLADADGKRFGLCCPECHEEDLRISEMYNPWPE